LTDSSNSPVAAIAERLRQDEPIERVERGTAAVAVMLRPGPSGEEVLLIKRAERAGDPWSGDVAFPGGRVEAGDGSFKEAAMREALEEVGADLSANASFLGYMDQFQARRKGIWVVPGVFLVANAVSIVGNSEVSSHMWIPLRDLLAGENRSTYTLELGDEKRSFPSFILRGYVVWGLTERILSSLVESVTGMAYFETYFLISARCSGFLRRNSTSLSMR
jgi:8-oxo-dGTP pyrophosphatase MutT (NUDIX family)